MGKREKREGKRRRKKKQRKNKIKAKEKNRSQEEESPTEAREGTGTSCSSQFAKADRVHAAVAGHVQRRRALGKEGVRDVTMT